MTTDPRRTLKKRKRASQSATPNPEGAIPHQVSRNEMGEELFCTCRKPDNGRAMIACDHCDEWFHCACVNITPEDEKLVVTYACPNCTKSKHVMSTWKPSCRLKGCWRPVTDSKYCSDAHALRFFKEALDAAEEKDKVVAVIRSLNAENFASFGKQRPIVPEDLVQRYMTGEDRTVERAMLEKQLEQWRMMHEYLDLLKDRIAAEANGPQEDQEGDDLDEPARKRKKKSSKSRNYICGMDPAAIHKEWDVITECVSKKSVDDRELCQEMRRKCQRHVDWIQIAFLEATKEERATGMKLKALDADLEKRRELAISRALHHEEYSKSNAVEVL